MAEDFEIVEQAPSWIASVRRRVPWSEVGRAVPELMGQVWAWAHGVRDRAGAGRSVVVYHQPSGDSVELEVGVQIAAPLSGAPAPIRCGRAPSGPAARVIHRGTYAELGRTHDALAAACRARGVTSIFHWDIFGDWSDDPAELAVEVHAALDPNAAQVAYWNGPAGDRWAAMWPMIDRIDAAPNEAVLALAAPRPGERVLDVGCGAGSTTLALQERVGPGGAVTGVDISAPMLAVACERAVGTGATFLEVDAAVHPFEPVHDLVFSRFGVMFFADPEAAFANLRRAAAPGGRLAFICWRAFEDNPWLVAPLAAVHDLLPRFEAPPPGAPGPFAFADGERLRGLLERAGWREVAIEQLDAPIRLGDDPEDAARAAMIVGPIARAIGEVSGEVRAQIAARLAEMLAAHASPTGVQLGAACWLVSALA